MYQQKRWTKETTERANRLNKGFRGLWDRLSGRYQTLARENERETLQSLHRDRQEKDNLIERHLDERHSYHQLARQTHNAHAKSMEQLHCDIADYMRMGHSRHPNLFKQFNETSKKSSIDLQIKPKDKGPIRGR